MRVMLATPTLERRPTVEYLMSVQKTSHLLMQRGHFLDTAFVGADAFIMKARNGLVQSFIESWKSEYPADVLVFIDDDQSWDENAFLRIIESPHEFVGVAIPKKMDTDPITFNNVQLDMDETGKCYIEHNMLRASQIGSGFIALKRSAVEKLIAAYPQRYAPGDGGMHALHYALFEAKIIWDEKDPTVTGQFWGEDLIFCKKWAAIGGKIWIEMDVNMEHIGRKSWGANFLQFLQKHASVELAKPVEVPPLPSAEIVPLPGTIEAIQRLAA